MLEESVHYIIVDINGYLRMEAHECRGLSAFYTTIYVSVHIDSDIWTFRSNIFVDLLRSFFTPYQAI